MLICQSGNMKRVGQGNRESTARRFVVYEANRQCFVVLLIEVEGNLYRQRISSFDDLSSARQAGVDFLNSNLSDLSSMEGDISV